MNYYWVRIFDYKHVDKPDTQDSYSFSADDKGVLLDEYYLREERMTREEAKNIVKEKSGVSRFAKPRNQMEFMLL